LEAIIRPARLSDAGALQRYCYPDHALGDVQAYLAWCLRQVEKGWIARLVAQVNGQAVGNAQLTIWGQEGEIGSLVVGQGYRQCGLATRLLTELIAEAARRDLVALEIRVCECQPAILAFYERLGFQRIVPLGESPPNRAQAMEARDGDTKNGLSHPARPGPIVRCRMLL
jgi:ribosomal protein S18 acetylase RimI-like enzyme